MLSDPSSTPPTTATMQNPRLPSGEGTVQFPPATVSYRYRVTAKVDKVHFWLEDSTSKQQWESEKLELQQFTTTETMIPQAAFDDYVLCFQSCPRTSLLEEPIESMPKPSPTAKIGESTECVRQLIPHGTDDWELRLTLKIKVFVSVWALTYSFLLKQISLEPIDVLSSKVRDQADQIKELEDEVSALTYVLDDFLSVPPMYEQGVATRMTSRPGNLEWESQSGDDINSPVIFKPNGIIYVKYRGVYAIQGIINGRSNGADVSLVVNGVKVVRIKAGNQYDSNCFVPSPLTYVMRLEAKDKLAVEYGGEILAEQPSYLTVHRIH